jgi:uncharacterized lipoprotein
MKKTSFALAVTALAMSVLVLSGCGMFRSHKAWDKAQQEAPLEIPPGLDTPSTSAALVIPEPGTGAPSATSTEAPQAVTDGFTVKDDVDAAYRRIGEMLGAGDLGQVVSHDDTAHTYQLAVPKATVAKSKGFFKRIFSSNSAPDKSSGGDASTTYTSQLTLSIAASGTGSEVRAQGDSAAVSRVIEALKSRLNR